jgi:hypothetical protein
MSDKDRHFRSPSADRFWRTRSSRTSRRSRSPASAHSLARSRKHSTNSLSEIRRSPSPIAKKSPPFEWSRTIINAPSGDGAAGPSPVNVPKAALPDTSRNSSPFSRGTPSPDHSSSLFSRSPSPRETRSPSRSPSPRGRRSPSPRGRRSLSRSPSPRGRRPSYRDRRSPSPDSRHKMRHHSGRSNSTKRHSHSEYDQSQQGAPQFAPNQANNNNDQFNYGWNPPGGTPFSPIVYPSPYGGHLYPGGGQFPTNQQQQQQQHQQHQQHQLQPPPFGGMPPSYLPSPFPPHPFQPPPPMDHRPSFTNYHAQSYHAGKVKFLFALARPIR